MRFLVLGSTRASRGDEPVDLGARKPRSIVAALAMTPGRPVSAELLADLVWAGDPPRAAHGALHSYLSGLRRAVEPDRPARGAGSVVETTDHGYVLRVPPDAVDAHAFAAVAAHTARLLAPLGSQLSGAGTDAGWPSRDDVVQALSEIDQALADWEGEPYADLPEHPDVLAARSALEQQRLAVEEHRLLGLLALGEHASVLAVTETAVGPHQLRERLWAVHALALARAGRQADALEALRTVRTVLVDELGLDPGAELRALEEALLRQDSSLATVLPRAASAPQAPVPVHMPAPAPHGTVGRDLERTALTSAVDEAGAGRVTFVQLVGEAGIGKTHLVEELVRTARERAFTVGVGGCARDEGAPPLWPWRSALAALGADVQPADPEESGASPEQRAFQLSERVATAAVGATAVGPVLLVVEDVHWADDATLRALVHLVDACSADTSLCVVVTRRPHPEPTGSLALLVEGLARRHAVRLDLSGLDPEGAADLVRSAGSDVPDDVAARWHERAAGNPFFLIELARFGAADPEAVPVTVLDVVTRRLHELPEPVLDGLRTAAVVGARFSVATVAAADDRDPVDVSDELDVAVRTGLVAEVSPEQFEFAHALTQEAVLATMTSTRAARRHAQVAHALTLHPGLAEPASRVAELARHWLAAGPSHVRSAWGAARAAADQASELTSYPEAMRLRRAAVEAHRRVVGGADEVHYELLLELATDAAYAAWWPEVEHAAFEAMTLGRTLGSPELVGRAAGALTRYCGWLPHVIDAVFEDAIDDLRWALAHVGDDAATRCRLQLALAVELYYVVGTAAERRALADSGMTLARSLDDPELTWWAAGAACMVAWNPAQLEDRLGWAAEGVAAARRAGDRRAEAVLLVTLALAQAEADDLDGWTASSNAAAGIARPERLAYPLMTLHWLWLSLAALRGEPDVVQQEFEALTATVVHVAVPMQELQVPFAWVAGRLWDPDQIDEVVDMFAAAHDEHGEAGTMVHTLLARAGRVEELRRALDAFPMPVEEEEYWSTVSDWASEAEAASLVGDASLARRAIAALSPYRGRMIIGGGAYIAGPVDATLALAHATVGDLELARELADAGTARAEAWGFTAFLAWLGRHRERLRF